MVGSSVDSVARSTMATRGTIDHEAPSFPPRCIVPLGTLLLLLVAGCGGLGPVPRAPWVEDRSLELHREVLIVDIGRTGAAVEAWFELRGSGAARELGFPIGGEAPAS